jgi:hypothetical protein
MIFWGSIRPPCAIFADARVWIDSTGLSGEFLLSVRLLFLDQFIPLWEDVRSYPLQRLD